MPSHAPSAELLTAGVDWLTATTHAGEDPAPLRAFGRWRLDQALAHGGKLRVSGHQGYRGHAANHVFWGERPDGGIVVLSGAEAQECWSVPVALAAHVTRLDLQVTAQLDRDQPRLAWQHYHQVERAQRREGRPIVPRIIYTPLRGDTLYLGARTSDVHARCYDKHREQPGQYPPGAWRYEVEYRHAPAQLAGTELLARSAVLPSVISTVHGWFADRGAVPAFSAPADLEGPLQLDLSRSRSDDEKSLTWLTEQVRATVARLVEHGRLDDVLRALGLELGGPVSRALR